MRIRYWCHYGKLTGYGRAARDYLAALAGTGRVELDIVPYEALTAPGDRAVSPEPRYAHLDQHVRAPADLGPADVEIHHSLPRLLAAVAAEDWPAARVGRTAAGRRVALTTWETSTFPAEYAAALRTFDATIVPSRFCAQAMQWLEPLADAPAWRGVHVVPHCFDPAAWPIVERAPDPWPAVDAATEPRATTFYTIGAWSERKNPLGVLRAYLHAFTKTDDVRLVMLCAGADFNEIRSTLARSGLRPAELPALEVPDRSFTERELLELHQQADCFVSATRAEGFGLAHFEAAILGKPIISPGYGGHADFLSGGPDGEGDIYYSPLLDVNYNLTPCFGQEVRGQIVEQNGQRMQMSKVAMPPGVTCKHLWAEPDLAEIARYMDSFHRSRPGYSGEQLDAERCEFEAKFGYNAVAKQMIDLLQEMR